MGTPSSLGPGAGRFTDRPGQAAVERAVGGAVRTERVLMAALVVGGAWLFVRSRALRRATWLLGRHAVSLSSAMVARELHRAWRDSAPRSGGDAA